MRGYQRYTSSLDASATLILYHSLFQKRKDARSVTIDQTYHNTLRNSTGRRGYLHYALGLRRSATLVLCKRIFCFRSIQIVNRSRFG